MLQPKSTFERIRDRIAHAAKNGGVFVPDRTHAPRGNVMPTGRRGSVAPEDKKTPASDGAGQRSMGEVIQDFAAGLPGKLQPGLTEKELQSFESTGRTDEPTAQMSPNFVAPDNENPALKGLNMQEKPEQNSGTANRTTASAGSPALDSYDKMLQYLDANLKAEAGERKRAKRNEMFAAIGDGISALSSMYQTTNGAPVTYTQGDDMSKVMRDRYDRMIAQRKAESDKYLNYLNVQAKKEQNEAQREYRKNVVENERKRNENQERNIARLEVKDAADAAELEWRHQLEINKFEYKKEKDNLDRQLKERQISISEYNAKTSRLNSIERERHDKEQEALAKEKENNRQNKGNNGKSAKANNTPPSRQNNNNTPPSRRKK